MNNWRKLCLVVSHLEKSVEGRPAFVDDCTPYMPELEEGHVKMSEFLPTWRQAADLLKTVNEADKAELVKKVNEGDKAELVETVTAQSLSSTDFVTVKSVPPPLDSSVIPQYKEEFVSIVFGGKKLLGIHGDNLMLLGESGITYVPGRIYN
eukprot:GHVS01040318.1.p1 GENE.GHVS01040318.1~~GHVS01040318.1.p1  ORF type:complete len:151 (+),score=22.82 GHVS01040318.1:242-694(+)